MFNLKTSIAVAALALAGAAQAAGPNLVADGTFAGSAGSFTTVNSGGSIGAWTVGGNSVDWIGSYWTPPVGQSIDLDGNAPGAISQTLTGLAAGEYTVTFDLSGNPDGGDATKLVDVSLGGSPAQQVSFTTGTSSGMTWATETLTFNVAAGDQTLSFVSADASGPYGAAIADVSVTAVPEPASLGLLLAGLGMIGVMSSRRRAR